MAFVGPIIRIVILGFANAPAVEIFNSAGFRAFNFAFYLIIQILSNPCIKLARTELAHSPPVHFSVCKEYEVLTSECLVKTIFNVSVLTAVADKIRISLARVNARLGNVVKKLLGFADTRLQRLNFAGVSWNAGSIDNSHFIQSA